MYDRPETRAAHERLWTSIRDHLRRLWKHDPKAGCRLPEVLEIDGDMWRHWRSPDLVLSQTCGLPYREHLHGEVSLVATADYGLPGCPPGHYNSVLVTRPGETRDWSDLRLAINGYDSQSGWAAPMNHAAGLGVTFGAVVVTGAHRASAAAVADGNADIAAIAAQSWRMITRWDDVPTALVEADSTEPTPGLPFISGMHAIRDELRTAIEHSCHALSLEDRAVLEIKGVTFIEPDAYRAIQTPKALQSV